MGNWEAFEMNNDKWAGGRVDHVGGPYFKALRLKDLEPGDTAYTLPWAYDSDDDGINENYPAYPEPVNTATLKVTRNSHGGYDIQFTEPYYD